MTAKFQTELEIAENSWAYFSRFYCGSDSVYEHFTDSPATKERYISAAIATLVYYKDCEIDSINRERVRNMMLAICRSPIIELWPDTIEKDTNDAQAILSLLKKEGLGEAWVHSSENVVLADE